MALLAAPVHAQTASTISGQAYPTKPIRFIVGFPPGGATEFIARLIGQKLTQSMGQQVIIDNRPGAAGNLGIELAARAAPDGYTLLLVAPNITISPSLYKKLAYDPVNREINQAMQATDVNEKLAAQSTKAIVGTPEAFGDYVKIEIAKWAEVVRKAGIQPE